jgi:hypothetical protein
MTMPFDTQGPMAQIYQRRPTTVGMPRGQARPSLTSLMAMNSPQAPPTYPLAGPVPQQAPGNTGIVGQMARIMGSAVADPSSAWQAMMQGGQQGMARMQNLRQGTQQASGMPFRGMRGLLSSGPRNPLPTSPVPGMGRLGLREFADAAGMVPSSQVPQSPLQSMMPGDGTMMPEIGAQGPVGEAAQRMFDEAQMAGQGDALRAMRARGEIPFAERFPGMLPSEAMAGMYGGGTELPGQGPRRQTTVLGHGMAPAGPYIPDAFPGRWGGPAPAPPRSEGRVPGAAPARGPEWRVNPDSPDAEARQQAMEEGLQVRRAARQDRQNLSRMIRQQRAMDQRRTRDVASGRAMPTLEERAAAGDFRAMRAVGDQNEAQMQDRLMRDNMEMIQQQDRALQQQFAMQQMGNMFNSMIGQGIDPAAAWAQVQQSAPMFLGGLGLIMQEAPEAQLPGTHLSRDPDFMPPLNQMTPDQARTFLRRRRPEGRQPPEGPYGAIRTGNFSTF